MRKKINEWLSGYFTLVLAVCIVIGGSTAVIANDDVLRVVDTYTINGFDIGNEKTTWPSYQLSWSMCDRLVTFGEEEVAPGFTVDDANEIKGELAESWEYNDDHTVLTVKIKEGAKFHNGDPVTAEDVVWSLARATVTPRTKNQMKVGGMVREDQFTVIDERTVQIKLDSANRYLLIDLVVPMAVIYNSKLIKANAASDDPWGLNWAMENGEGICSGAYKVTDFKPNQSFRLTRNDEWVSGPKPYFKKVVYQTVRDTSSIASLIERGRADVSVSIGLKELLALERRGKVKTKVVAMPYGAYFVAFDMTKPMFSDKRVRHAMAYSMPYKEWHESTFFDTGERLDGGTTFTPTDGKFLQKFPFTTDLDKAKALLNEAGIPEGTVFPFAFSESLAALFEPFAVLWKENLKKIGYDLDIQKLTAAVFAEGRNNDKLPMFGDPIGAWLGGSPDYFFRIFYSGDWRDNAGNYDNKELQALLTKNISTFDSEQYKTEVNRMVAWAFDDLPMMVLRYRTQRWAVAKDIEGIHTPFANRWDFRRFKRAK
jgi:peptide/nickel transport system substrate-binding protein